MRIAYTHFGDQSGVTANVTRALEALGHEVKVWGMRSSAFGFGQAVRSDASGVHAGASDPRHDGAAIPQPIPLKR